MRQRRPVSSRLSCPAHRCSSTGASLLAKQYARSGQRDSASHDLQASARLDLSREGQKWAYDDHNNADHPEGSAARIQQPAQ
jgi:hypothetical protein